MDFTSRTLEAGLSKQCIIIKNIKGTCGVWSGDETITPRGFRNLPGNTKFRKTLQILKERLLVNSIKQEYTIQQANYYLERKAATAA